MEHTFGKQARPACIALAAGAFMALGGITIAIAQTAPATTPTFVSAKISIELSGDAAGGLTCAWRETGLPPSMTIYYSCGAGAVVVLRACVYKNKVIYQSPTRLDVFKNVSGAEEGEGGNVPFLSTKNGQGVSASTTTLVPEVESEGQELCLAPSAATIVAVRWCNALLKDVTDNVVGATSTELFQEFYSGVGTVPDCTTLSK